MPNKNNAATARRIRFSLPAPRTDLRATHVLDSGGSTRAALADRDAARNRQDRLWFARDAYSAPADGPLAGLFRWRCAAFRAFRKNPGDVRRSRAVYRRRN